MASCCEHGNELSRSVIRGSFNYLRNCKLLKKDSTVWSQCHRLALTDGKVFETLFLVLIQNEMCSRAWRSDSDKVSKIKFLSYSNLKLIYISIMDQFVPHREHCVFPFER